jgi:hypothetical protein
MIMLHELFVRIESVPFSARLGVLSGFESFLRALPSIPDIHDLVGAISVPEGKNALLNRILELAEQKVAPDYENPWDIPLAAYLWTLFQVDAELAPMAAAAVLKAQDCWWAKKLAQNILDAPLAKSAPLTDPKQLAFFNKQRT